MLFLDECIPRGIVPPLLALLADRPEAPTFKHALDLYAEGMDDRAWAEAAKHGKWLPISADRGQSNRGEKLPRIFKELGLVNIQLSGQVHSLPARDKVLAIAACWMEIEQVWRHQVGCTHSLRLNDNGHGFRLIDVEAQRAKRAKRAP